MRLRLEMRMEELRGRLAGKAERVSLRYRFYEMKQAQAQVSALIPAEFRKLSYSLGWCAKAVDGLADRIVPDGFEEDAARIGEIYRQSNADVLFGSAVLSALISACCFIYIGRGTDGFPKLQVIDGGNATGVIDPATNLLTEGYAVIKRDELSGLPEVEAYFLPGRTEYYRYGDSKPFQVFRHKAPYPLLVPVIFRPDAHRPFGHSRISRGCMDIVQTVLRTLLRSEVAAEFYSVPQKYALGMSGKFARNFEPPRATLSSFLVLTNNEETKQPPHVGQFQTGSMQPFTEQLRTLAALFAAETGMTLDDLGFTTENPSSEEAIKAAHENLRLTARSAQRTFGTGFVNAGYLAACVRDGYGYDRQAFADTRCSWLPIFEPDAAALGVIGDAVLKINQASEGFMGERNLRAITGLRSDAET